VRGREVKLIFRESRTLPHAHVKNLSFPAGVAKVFPRVLKTTLAVSAGIFFEEGTHSESPR
jgi:hypothetical protein